MGKAKIKYYAVKKGRHTGIFHTWQECLEEVHGFSGAVYKGFAAEQEALDWLAGEEGQSVVGPGERCAGAPDSEYIDVYTDGSYVDGRYAWAYAFVRDDRVIWEASGVGKNPEAAAMRNVAGELAAVLYAVQKAAEMNVRICIHHDYAGVALWVTKDWKAQNEYTKKYCAWMEKYRGIYRFAKVTAHSGNRFNDYVDQKAKAALGI